MNTVERLPEKCKLFLKQCLNITLGIIIIFFICNLLNQPDYIIDEERSLYPIKMTGSWQRDNENERHGFDDYKDISVNDCNRITLRGHLTQDISADQALIMYIYNLQVEMFVNGKLLYQTKNSEYTRWDIINSAGISTDDEVTIIMHGINEKSTADSMRLFLNKLSGGTRYGLLMHQIENNFIKIALSIVVMIIGLAMLIVMGMLNYFRMKMMNGYVPCALLLIVGSVCTFIDYEYVTLIFRQLFIVNIIDQLSQLLICAFMMQYINVNLKNNGYRRVSSGMMIMWRVMLIIYCGTVMWTGNIGSSRMMEVYSVLSMLILFNQLVFMLLEYSQYKTKRVKYILVSMMVLLGCTIAEIIKFYITGVFWIYVFQLGLLIFTGVQFSVLLIQTRIRFEKAEKVKDLEKELMQSQIDIMLSQISPHFIFNALNTISGLCLIAPQKADQALMYFSNYLRANIKSLQSRELVPFEEEMKNIKCYMEIEKLRFGERVSLEFDIKVYDFKLPMLTLEPLIENSVKHGLLARPDGGRVILRTWYDGNRLVITIEDDGVGFDVDEKNCDNRGVGMKNVRKRLEYMINAEMQVESEPDKGTKITIRMPLLQESGDDL